MVSLNKAFEAVTAPAGVTWNLDEDIKYVASEAPSKLNEVPCLSCVPLILNPAISPAKAVIVPDIETAEAVICPLAPFSFNVPAVELKSSPIVNPPSSPPAAVIIPLIVTLPSEVRWKLEELISILPFEPLMYWPVSPK